MAGTVGPAAFSVVVAFKSARRLAMPVKPLVVVDLMVPEQELVRRLTEAGLRRRKGRET